MKKKRVLIIAGIIAAAVIVVLAGIPVKRWIDDQNRRYMIHPYIVYNGTVYIDDTAILGLKSELQ